MVRCLARWRKLEGSDPATFEMIMRCQALQRRLILATEENVAKDGEIQVGLWCLLKAAVWV